HKIDKIQKILNAYQGVPFVLVGDSGQKDPEIYQKIVAENPGRISQVYIRDVKRSKKRKLKQFADTIEQYGVRFQILNR
ncbi:MAG: App1 family protein, partial [Marinoscillum sp.]